MHIKYLRETSPLGQQAAISLMEQRPSLPVVVTNGDVFTDIKAFTVAGNFIIYTLPMQPRPLNLANGKIPLVLSVLTV